MLFQATAGYLNLSENKHRSTTKPNDAPCCVAREIKQERGFAINLSQGRPTSEYLKTQINTNRGVNNHPDRTPLKVESNNRNGRTGVRKTGGCETSGRR
jgi:hypothetical protein